MERQLGCQEGLSGQPVQPQLISARFFSAGFDSTNGKMNETTEYRSPRDSDRHETHTSTLGYAKGIAVGMAPKARLAGFCWSAGCYDLDILAAVSDSCYVVSLSVGGVVVPAELFSFSIFFLTL
ncbi:hypothetical protein ACFXTH_001584 [Malus domestica]